MKTIPIILLALCVCTIAGAAPLEAEAPTTNATTTAPATTAPATTSAPAPTGEDDFIDDGPAPLLGLLVLVVVLVIIGFAAIVGLLGLGVLALLIFAAIVSSSVIVGLASKRTSHGFRALFLQLGGVGGLLVGSGVFYGVGRLLQAPLSPLILAAIGGGLGLALGLLAGWAFNAAWTWVVGRLTSKNAP